MHNVKFTYKMEPTVSMCLLQIIFMQGMPIKQPDNLMYLPKNPLI